MLLTRRGSRSTFFVFIFWYFVIPWIVRHGDVPFVTRSRASIQLLGTISGGPKSHSFVAIKLYSLLHLNISAGSSESQANNAAARSCATIIIAS